MTAPSRILALALLALATRTVPQAAAADRPGAGNEPRLRQERLRRTYGHRSPRTSLTVSGKPISFTFFVKEADRFPRAYLEEAVRVASEISLATLRAEGRENCDKGGDLDIFEVSFAELNAPGQTIPYPEAQLGNAWGYYDPGSPYDGLDGIYFVHHGERTTRGIVAHEIAHYWYERLCVYARNPTTSEEFASRVEQRYAARHDD